MVKNLPANAEDTGDSSLTPGSRRSPGLYKITSVFLPGESHGQSSLAGYSPWSREESNTTKCLNTHTRASIFQA